MVSIPLWEEEWSGAGSERRKLTEMLLRITYETSKRKVVRLCYSNNHTLVTSDDFIQVFKRNGNPEFNIQSIPGTWTNIPLNRTKERSKEKEPQVVHKKRMKATWSRAQTRVSVLAFYLFFQSGFTTESFCFQKAKDMLFSAERQNGTSNSPLNEPDLQISNQKH